MAAVSAAKKELRKSIKTTLAGVSRESIKSQSSRALDSLFSMPQYQAAQRISVYLSMPSGEILTTGIIHDAFQRGKEVFVPFIYRLAEPQAGQPKSIIDMLKLSSVQEFEGLQSDAWGIPSLDEETIPQRPNSFGWAGKSEGRIVNDDDDESRKRGLDLVVVPGQAFDASFGRLGHGKGFYDLFFERTRRQADLRSSKMPFLVGLSLEEQFLDSSAIPMNEADWPLDALIVGNGRLLSREK